MEPTTHIDEQIHPDPADARPGRGEVVVFRNGIKASRLVLAAGRSLPPHNVSMDVVVVVVRGHGRFIVDEEIRDVHPGDILDFIPDERHAVEADEELELVLVECPRVEGATTRPPPLPR